MYRRRRRGMGAALVSLAASLLVVFSCLVAGLVGTATASRPKQHDAAVSVDAEKTEKSAAIDQRHLRHGRELQSAVLIHLVEDCQSCIGVSATADSRDTGTSGSLVEEGATLIKVDCDSESLEIEKFWRFSNGGNWCLRNDEDLCITFDSAQSSTFSIQPIDRRQMQFFFHETAGEITRFSNPEQCIVMDGAGNIELQRCASNGDGAKLWAMPTSGEYECDPTPPSSAPSASPVSDTSSAPSDVPTPSPSAAPTTPMPTNMPSVLPTESPSFSPTAAPSASPTTAFPTVSPSTSAPSASPVSSTSAPATNEPSPSPSAAPTTPAPTNGPSVLPTESPTFSPTATPSASPTTSPIASGIPLDSVGEEEYDDGVTSEVGDKVITTDSSPPTRPPTLSPKEIKAIRKKQAKEKKKQQNRQKQLETFATSPPTRRPALSPKEKRKNRRKKALEKKKQQLENAANKLSSVPSNMPSVLPTSSPTAAPSPDDGISITQVDYSLSVRYSANLTEDEMLTMVQSTTYALLQDSVNDATTDLYRLALQDGLEDVRVTSSSVVEGSDAAKACQSPPNNVMTTKCSVLEVGAKATHDDTASGGEVRYALLALTQDIIERLQLQLLQASNLGPRVVSYNNRMVIGGVADDEPPTPEAIAVYEEALRSLLRSEMVSDEAPGFDVVHLEVTSANVQASVVSPGSTNDGSNTATDADTGTDNIFHKESDRNDGSAVSKTEQKLRMRRNLQAEKPSVTFDTLILGEYASPSGVDADLNAIIADNVDTVRTDLVRSGAQYFESVDYVSPATDSPTASPTEAPPPKPQVDGSTDSFNSKQGLSTGAIVGIAVSAAFVLLSAVAFFVIWRKRQSGGKKMLSNEEFDALQRQRRNDLALNSLDRDPHDSFRSGRSKRNGVPGDTASEGSDANDSYYNRNLEQGWNEVEDPRGDGSGAKARTDLGDRWAAFEQDETLEQQKTEANSNAVLMSLRRTIRRAWGGNDDDQQSTSTGSDYFAETAGMKEEKEEDDEDFLRNLQTLYVQGKVSKGEFVTMKEAHLRKQQMQEEEDEARQAAGTHDVPDDESSLFSSNPEIERMYRAGEISEEEYHQMLATHDRLKQAQSGDDHGSAVVAGGAVVRDDESLFSSNPEAELLYQEGAISKQEYDQIRDTHHRLKRSQKLGGDDAMHASLLDDMSGDEEDMYPNTLGNNDNANEPMHDEVPEDDETLFSNNAEMDQLYREGKITAAEWRQMKSTHDRLRQEQKRNSGSDDMDEYDELENEDYRNDGGDGWDRRRRSEAEEEGDSFEEEERRRSEEEEAVRLRIKEQFRRAEEEAAAQKARMQDEWRRSSEPSYDDDGGFDQPYSDEDKSKEYYDEEDEEYDNFNEDHSLFTTSNEIERMYKSGQISRQEYEEIQASHGSLKEVEEHDRDTFHEDQSVTTNATTSYEIKKLFSEGAISESEMTQMLENHRRLKHAQEGTDERDIPNGTDEDGSVFTTSNEIQRLYEEGAISQAEMKEMQLNHNRLRKSQKLEEIERMYRDGEVDENDYHLLLDSYERLQEEKSSPSAGEDIEMNDMKPAATSSAPELTPDAVSVYSTNSEIEQLYKDGMLDETEYRQMRETHSRLRKVQKGEKPYRAAEKAPALW
mmetsp:Transcript_15918/g.34495  ORF Transcript_15918/g.34495 Transcript_15918/m.34495 type:complete len:1626 (+) Transcript_15918:394-5271(+)